MLFPNVASRRERGLFLLSASTIPSLYFRQIRFQPKLIRQGLAWEALPLQGSLLLLLQLVAGQVAAWACFERSGTGRLLAPQFYLEGRQLLPLEPARIACGKS